MMITMMMMMSIIMITGYSLNDDCVINVDDDNDRVVVVQFSTYDSDEKLSNHCS